MTDNTQELDEILALLGARIPQPKTMNEATTRVAMLQGTKQAILDWHNKQIEAVLDRLEAQCGETIDNTLGKPIRIKFVSVSAIEAERNKLEAEL